MMTALFGNWTVEPIDMRASRACRLTAKVLEAFTLACELDDLEAAEAMLKAAEDIMVRQGAPAIRQCAATSQSLVDAHFRLWEMRYLER